MRLKKRQMRILFLMLLSLFAYSTWVTYSSAQILSNEDFIRLRAGPGIEADCQRRAA